MPPVYKARDPAGVITDISQYFRELTLDVTTNAEEGSNAQSTVQADDPDGTFDLVGHRIFTVQEDTAAVSSNSTIYVGYSAARRISRGPYHRTQAGRVWDIDLVDLNSVLPRRIMDGTDANARIRRTSAEAAYEGPSRALTRGSANTNTAAAPTTARARSGSPAKADSRMDLPSFALENRGKAAWE